MEDTLKLVSNFGFPIVVALVLLTKTEKKLDSLGDAISGLKESIVKLITLIEAKRK